MEEKSLQKYLSPLNAWGLAVGCAAGWGAFVMPGVTLLPLAGPLGTPIGLFLGGLAIVVIGFNYLSLMKRFPEAGGAFSYVKNVFGYDHGFLNAWFILLTYVAIVWANAAGLTLISERLSGNFFRTGFHYKVLGDSVYLGEIVLSATVLIFFAIICMYRKKLAGNIQTLMAIVLLGGIIGGGIMVMNAHKGGLESFEPLFAPDRNPVVQILTVAVLAPWAFVGFESISNSAEEFKFPLQKTLAITILSILGIFIAYGFPVDIAAAILPREYDSWTQYVENLDSIDGLKSIPTFFAASQAMGEMGVWIFGLAASGVIITGIVGSYIAASRLVFAVARDGIIPSWFCELSDDGTPRNAIKFVCGLSLFASIVGKTFTSWTVDLLSVGASIVYVYVSAASYVSARETGDSRAKVLGFIGMIFSILFTLCLFVPNLLAISTMSAGSYLVLCVWGIIGLAISRRLLDLDALRRFGRSVIVYVAMLFLIFFSSLMWMRQETSRATEDAIIDLRDFYTLLLHINHVHRTPRDQVSDEHRLERSLNEVSASIFSHSLVQMMLMFLSLSIMFNIYATTSRRESRASEKKQQIERHNEFLERHARTDPLTGLLNKKTSEDALELICRESQGTLVIIDLDSFKLVNDLYGHAMGDEILIVFAKIIREVVAPNDLAGRLGGDEFVAFCHDLFEEDQIARKSRTINSRILEEAKRLMGEDMNIPLGASLGCVRIPKEGNDFSELFKKADRALYSVKQAGKHGYKLFTQEMAESDETSNLVSVEMILSERNRPERAMMLPLEDFRAIYRLLQRREETNANCLLLFTLLKPDDEFIDSLQKILRRTDLIMKSGRNQVVAILCDVSYNEMDAVVTRLERDLIDFAPFKCEWSVIK